MTFPTAGNAPSAAKAAFPSCRKTMYRRFLFLRTASTCPSEEVPGTPKTYRTPHAPSSATSHPIPSILKQHDDLFPRGGWTYLSRPCRPGKTKYRVGDRTLCPPGLPPWDPRRFRHTPTCRHCISIEPWFNLSSLFREPATGNRGTFIDTPGIFVHPRSGYR